jgi:hemerythrin
MKDLTEWDDDYKIGQSEIDSQHEEIFKLALKVSKLSRDPVELGRLRVAFIEFGNALKEHFAYEEELLANIGHPTLDAHRAEHAAMVTELDFICQGLVSKVDGWPFQEEALVILDFMLGVMVGHILHCDADCTELMRGPQHTGREPAPAHPG